MKDIATYLAAGGKNFLGHDINGWIDLLHSLHKLGLTPETAHELLDRMVFAAQNGGSVIITPEGPRLDDDSESLFIIGRKVRS